MAPSRAEFELQQYEEGPIKLFRRADASPPGQQTCKKMNRITRDAKAVLREIAGFLGLDPNPLEHVDISRKYNSYAAPRNQYLRRLAGAKFSRMVGQTLIPHRLGAFIFERIFLKQAPKPPLDPHARELLCSLYDPELDKLEKLLGRRLPELRHSWITWREAVEPR